MSKKSVYLIHVVPFPTQLLLSSRDAVSLLCFIPARPWQPFMEIQVTVVWPGIKGDPRWKRNMLDDVGSLSGNGSQARKSCSMRFRVAVFILAEVENPPAMQELQKTQVWSLGQEDPPGVGNGHPLQYSCLENFMDRKSLGGCNPWGHKKSDMTEHVHVIWKKKKKSYLK